MQRHTLFLAVLYAACVALLSFIFVVGPQPASSLQRWEYWLGITFLLSTLYFVLLVRFEEGFLFWILLILGIGVVLY